MIVQADSAGTRSRALLSIRCVKETFVGAELGDYVSNFFRRISVKEVLRDYTEVQLVLFPHGLTQVSASPRYEAILRRMSIGI